MLDYSHGQVTASKGEIVLGRNTLGRFIAIKIVDVSTRKPHQLSSILKVEYRIIKNAKGDFSASLESAYPLEDVRTFDEAWISDTIAKAFQISVFPVLERVRSMYETIQSLRLIGDLMISPTITWERTKTEYSPLRIKTVRGDQATYKTFRVFVSRKAMEEESISRELRCLEERWEIDVRLDFENGIPSSLKVTRIYDTTTEAKAEWNEPLPTIDVKEYF